MANAMRKVAEYLGIFDSGEYVDDQGQFEFESDDRSLRVNGNSYLAQPRNVAPHPDVYRITTLHPHTYNDARRIGEEFRVGTPVIMNLTDMDDTDARRIVDFSAGLAFGLHGTIEKVTKGVFLLSPANIDVGAAARAQLREDPFFNQS